MLFPLFSNLSGTFYISKLFDKIAKPAHLLGKQNSDEISYEIILLD